MGESGRMIHDFQTSLQRSHSASDLPIWIEIYKQAFPQMQACIDHRADGEHQRAGIDRSVILENSKQILIDEKIRWKDYPDIALEYLSSAERNIPGWVCKPLRADYICYAIAPTGMAYLLPVPQMQNAWLANGEAWKKQYFIANAKNAGYTTKSVCVPVNVLFSAIGKELRVSFTPLREAA